MTGNEVDRYQAPPGLMRYSAQEGQGLALPEHDSWLYTFAQTVQLAEYVQYTDFVPKELKGNPPAIASVILSGREMRLGPMASLKHIFTVRGRPSQTAEIMRAQVLQAGHEIDFPEPTDTKAIIRGRRRPVGEWMQVTFTSDMARRAGIDLGKYPADKLFARASSRLCRRLFADVISGLPTIEEAEDAALEESGASVSALPTGTTSTRRRRTPLNLDIPPQSNVGTVMPPPVPARPTQPPLPGEEVTEADVEYPDVSGGGVPYLPPVAPTDPIDAEPVTTAEEEEGAIDEAQRAAAEPGSVNPQQLRALGASFGRLKLGGKDNDEDRHLLTSHLIDRRVTTWSDLSYDEAGKVLTTVGNVKRDEIETFVRDGLNAAVLRFEDDTPAETTEADASE